MFAVFFFVMTIILLANPQILGDNENLKYGWILTALVFLFFVTEILVQYQVITNISDTASVDDIKNNFILLLGYFPQTKWAVGMIAGVVFAGVLFMLYGKFENTALIGILIVCCLGWFFYVGYEFITSDMCAPKTKYMNVPEMVATCSENPDMLSETFTSNNYIIWPWVSDTWGSCNDKICDRGYITNWTSALYIIAPIAVGIVVGGVVNKTVIVGGNITEQTLTNSKWLSGSIAAGSVIILLAIGGLSKCSGILVKNQELCSAMQYNCDMDEGDNDEAPNCFMDGDISDGLSIWQYILLCIMFISFFCLIGLSGIEAARGKMKGAAKAPITYAKNQAWLKSNDLSTILA